MKKSKEPIERKNLSSGEFTKLFIKHFILNSIFIGIILGVIYAVTGEFLPSIAKTIVGFILVFVGIVKIYLSAINDSFFEGKINQSDIGKIANNIIIVFVVMFLIMTAFNLFTYFNSLKLAKAIGLEDIATRNFIINIVIGMVMYSIIAIFCRIKFIKESSESENII